MKFQGVVSFNDLYVYKEDIDISKYSRLANTVAHELSHHWFGNFVTMKWWDNLWLNESFADFISHFCLTKIKIESKPIQNMWLVYNNRKLGGYTADQMIQTHPICLYISDTNVANQIFDGITYNKGGATLR